MLEAGGWPQGEAWVQVIPSLLAGLDRHPLARRVLAGQEPEKTARLLDIPALQELEARVADDLRLGQTLGLVRTDIDVDLVASGLESLVLALLIAIETTGAGVGDERRTQGVMGVLSSAIRPGAGPPPR